MYDHRRCASCKYATKVNEGIYSCDYILIEGHMRGCYDTTECDKYTIRIGQKPVNKDWGYFHDDEHH